MFKMTFKPDFDPDKLLRQAKDAAARDLERNCQNAAAPYGGVTVRIERAIDGTPSKISLEGSDAAIAAAKRVFS